jgi:hypothetical protein
MPCQEFVFWVGVGDRRRERISSYDRDLREDYDKNKGANVYDFAQIYTA